MLSSAAQQGRLVINPLIYAEVACGFANIEDLDAALPLEYFNREPVPWPAGFLAARCFSRIADAAAPARAPCPTSSSARTPRWPATHC